MIINIKDPEMDKFQLSKRKKPVKILFDTGFSKAVNAVIMLNLNSRSGSGEETLKEYLNNSRNFIPIKLKKPDEYRIFNINDIVYILEKERSNILVQKKINLALPGKIQIKVGQFKNLPGSRARFLDYLNSDEQFVCFLYKGAKIYINKDKILNGVDNG